MCVDFLVTNPREEEGRTRKERHRSKEEWGEGRQSERGKEKVLLPARERQMFE